MDRIQYNCMFLSMKRKDIFSCFVFFQSSIDAPTTPKISKDQRDIFFPASFSTPCLLTNTHPISTQDGEAKLNKTPRPLLTQTHSTPTQIYCPPTSQPDQLQQRKTPSQPIASMAYLPHTGIAFTFESLFIFLSI